MSAVKSYKLPKTQKANKCKKCRNHSETPRKTVQWVIRRIFIEHIYHFPVLLRHLSLKCLFLKKYFFIWHFRMLRRRPRTVLSEDGSKVLNVWFLPHHTEMLVAYKKLSDQDCYQALSYHLVIVAALHDILQYLCAHSQLGSAQARLGSRADFQLSADWGGINGIGSLYSVHCLHLLLATGGRGREVQ